MLLVAGLKRWHKRLKADLMDYHDINTLVLPTLRFYLGFIASGDWGWSSYDASRLTQVVPFNNRARTSKLRAQHL